jgi:hypothetical protein
MRGCREGAYMAIDHHLMGHQGRGTLGHVQPPCREDHAGAVAHDLRKEAVSSSTNSDTWFYLKAVPCGSGAVFSTLESRMSVRVVDGQPFSNGCCIEFRIR